MKLSEINHQKLKEHLEIEYLFKALESEIYENKIEIKPNNIPYLEDKLADIMWSWFMLTKRLEKIAFVTSQEQILKRALKKFQERVLPMNGNLEHDKKIWKEVKARQKERLALEQSKYE